MTSYTPATAEANAKLIRSLVETLPKPYTLNHDTLLSTIIRHQAFNALSKQQADTILPPLLASLTSPSSRAFTFRTICYIASTTTPSVYASIFQALSQKLTSLYKTSLQTDAPQCLVALAAIVNGCAPLTELGGLYKAQVSTVCQSALQHAMRVLEGEHRYVQTDRAALTLVFSVLHTAPREMRAVLHKLERVLVDRYICDEQVGDVAVVLYCFLVRCYAEKMKGRATLERFNMALSDMEYMLKRFSFDEAQAFGKVGINSNMNGVKIQSAQVWIARYCTMCDVIIHTMTQYSNTPVSIPLSRLLCVLLRGVEETRVDPYESIAGMESEDMQSVISAIAQRSFECLADAVQTCGKTAILPYVGLIGTAFNMRLAKLVLRCRKQSGAMACISERVTIYTTVTRLVRVLGSGFMTFVLSLFQELFEGDEKLMSSCARKTVKRLSFISDLPRRKRRRHNRGGNAHMESETDVESLLGMHGPSVTKAQKRLFEAGCETAEAMFENRGLLSESCLKHLSRIESVLARYLRNDGSTVCSRAMKAVCAAALGGGANRMTACASPLLLPCAEVATNAVVNMRFVGDVRHSAGRIRAAVESVFHPRGPPYRARDRVYLKDAGDSSAEARVGAKRDRKEAGTDEIVLDEEMQTSVREKLPSAENEDKGENETGKMRALPVGDAQQMETGRTKSPDTKENEESVQRNRGVPKKQAGVQIRQAVVLEKEKESDVAVQQATDNNSEAVVDAAIPVRNEGEKSGSITGKRSTREKGEEGEENECDDIEEFTPIEQELAETSDKEIEAHDEALKEEKELISSLCFDESDEE